MFALQMLMWKMHWPSVGLWKTCLGTQSNSMKMRKGNGKLVFFFNWTLQIIGHSVTQVLCFYFQVRVRFCQAYFLNICTVLRKSGKTEREKHPHVCLQLSPQRCEWLHKMGKFPYWWGCEGAVFCLSCAFSIYQMKSLPFPFVSTM